MEGRLLAGAFFTFILAICFQIPSATGQIRDSGFIKIRNGKLFYKVYGSGEPIVYLNGGPGFSSKSYEYITNYLSDYQVILFDQRGTGKSTIQKVNEKTIHIKKMVNDLEALRTHLGFEQWTVIGNSFGGKYAMFYASKYPDRIKKMVLIASVGVPEKGRRGDYKKFKKVTADNALPCEQDLLETIDNEMNKVDRSMSLVYQCKLALRSRNYVENMDNLQMVVDWFMSVEDHHKIGRFVSRSTYKHSLSEQLKQFQQPVLIIHGEDDFIKTSMATLNHSIFPNSQLRIIENSGHIVWLEQPKKVKSLIDEFLRK